MGSDWTAGGWRGQASSTQLGVVSPLRELVAFHRRFWLSGAPRQKLARVPTAGNYLGVWAGWCNGPRSILQLAGDDSTSLPRMEREEGKSERSYKTPAILYLNLLGLCVDIEQDKKSTES
jgi:hypothetical protein